MGFAPTCAVCLVTLVTMSWLAFVEGGWFGTAELFVMYDCFVRDQDFYIAFVFALVEVEA